MNQKPRRVAITPSEIASEYGIGLTTVYALIRDGQIPAARIGKRKLLVMVSRLEEWLAANEATQVSKKNAIGARPDL